MVSLIFKTLLKIIKAYNSSVTKVRKPKQGNIENAMLLNFINTVL